MRRGPSTGLAQTRRSRERARGPAQLAQAERAATAVALRAHGYRQIAATLGCSVATAFGVVARALAKLPAEDAPTMRAVEGARLDLIWAALLPAVQRGNPEACAAAVRVSAARCRLYGLNAPIRAEVLSQAEAITVVFSEALRPPRSREIVEAFAHSGRTQGNRTQPQTNGFKT